VRGEDYIAVLDGHTFVERTRIKVPAGPGMQIFSPDGKYGYVCASFNPETVVISVADHAIVGQVAQASPFCPDLAATPDGSQVWFTLKDIGKTQVFDTKPPFARAPEPRDKGPPFNHSITSSARSKMDCGTARPSALAVLRFTTISNFVGNCTGRSPGFAPRRMRST
jgi:DNA-binding beta-propeller fold protein YncE